MPQEETPAPEVPQPAPESPTPTVEGPVPAIESSTPPAESTPVEIAPEASAAPAEAVPAPETAHIPPDEPFEPTSTGPQGPLPFSTADDRQKNQVAQIPPSEPIAPESEPIAPAPARVTAPPEPPPAASAPVILAPVRAARDLLMKARVSIQDRKRKKRDRIMEVLATKSQITNDEVEKILHVSDATATRYLSALEKEGKIIQVGKQGKGVLYIKTP